MDYKLVDLATKIRIKYLLKIQNAPNSQRSLEGKLQ